MLFWTAFDEPYLMDSIELVRLLGTEYSLAILRATHTPKSAQELSTELDIPIATTYRRLNTLAEADLLREVPATEQDEDAGPTVYQRTIDDVRITFDHETIELTVQDRYDVYPALRDLWYGCNAMASDGESST